jgi:outer membrane protein assembly factor BamB
MVGFRTGLIGIGLVLSAHLNLCAADWPQWGGQNCRNMVASEKGLPASFEPGKKKTDGSGIDLKTTRNVRWVAKLGTETYTSPVISGGRVFIATNDQSLKDPRFEPTGGGLLMCLDETSGALRWQLVVPRLPKSAKFRKFPVRKWDLGIVSTPTVDGDRVYVVSNRAEVLCLDVNGLANGNDGPFQDEARYSVEAGKPPVQLKATDADIIWRFDMLAELEIFPHDANCCSVLIDGNVLYVGTANGVDNSSTPCPLAPSVVALDKRTGRLIGYDNAKIGTRVFHGQWCSPSLAKVGGKTLVLYAGGDGWCYAFEALAEAPAKPAALKCVWSCDCNPPEFRVRNGKPIDYWEGDIEFDTVNRNDGEYVGPCEVIATPVCYRNRVYVAIGRDPSHGKAKGMLTCIDPTQTGDVTKTGKLWTYAGIQRTLCSAAVVDDLLYIGDVAGTVHCLDAETGRCYWTHPTKQEAWSSLLVADGKIYFGNKRNFVVLAAGRSEKVLSEMRLGTPIWCPATAANGTLYVASQRYLWAVRETGHDMLTAVPAPGGAGH